MTQAAPIPFSTLEDVHVKEPFQEVELPEPQVTAQVTAQVTPQVSQQETFPLHELTDADKLLITRRLRTNSILFFRGKKYRFLVRTEDRSLIYTVEEENSWWVGYFCYGLRPMQLLVRNRVGEEVMRIDRPFACTTRLFPCQLQVVQVFSPPGTRIGSIEQQWTPIRPEYIVKKDDGEHLFHILGPRLTVSCFNDIRFQINRVDGRAAGSTCKEWPGLFHALCFSAIVDRFGVVFENDLTAQEKALLLAASILLDYMYYNL